MPMPLLALSGSLRAGPFSTDALRTLQRLAPEGIAVSLYEGIGSLPHFNPVAQTSAQPEMVAEFRRQVAAADGVIIARAREPDGDAGSMASPPRDKDRSQRHNSGTWPVHEKVSARTACRPAIVQNRLNAFA